MSGCALHQFWRTPVEPEILAEVKDEILYNRYFATFDADHGHAAIVTYSSISICKMDIPMNSNDTGSSEGKDVRERW
jgi:hypothetical protein